MPGEITLYRILFRSPRDGSIHSFTEWMDKKPEKEPTHGTVIQITGTPTETTY